MKSSKVKAIFVSDIHVGEINSPRSLLFLNFLKKLGTEIELTHFFMVGDIFDLWIGRHSYFIKKYKGIIDELCRLKASGVDIHYFEGNHDLYLRDYWERELGFQVHPGPEEFTFEGFKVCVEHGDQVDPEDYGYRFLRWFLRTPFMVVVARYLPEKVVVKIGESASSHSRTYTSEVKTVSDEEAKSKLRTFAEQKYKKSSYDFLITGHLHINDDFVMSGGGRSINLGTWLHRPQYLQLEGQEAQWFTVESD